jgi:hypothetical protein
MQNVQLVAKKAFEPRLIVGLHIVGLLIVRLVRQAIKHEASSKHARMKSLKWYRQVKPPKRNIPIRHKGDCGFENTESNTPDKLLYIGVLENTQTLFFRGGFASL